MRLLRLYLGEHRVLKELDIPFDMSAYRLSGDEQPYHLDFLVGVNGSGKSTVLRVLAYIFQSIQIQVIETPFILEYWLSSQQQKVRICNIDPREDDVDYKKPLGAYFLSKSDSLQGAYDLENPQPKNLIDNIPSDVIPKRVVAYTTGEEESWQFEQDAEPFERSSVTILEVEKISHEEQARKELPGWSKEERESETGYSSNFWLIPKEHLNLVALCGLLINIAEADDVPERPLHKIFQEENIQTFSGFSLKFNLRNASLVERDTIRDRLAILATRAIRNGGEYRLVFDLTNPNIAQRLLSENGSGLELFEFLSRHYEVGSKENKLLTELCLFFERSPEKEDGNGKKRTPHLHTWEWLSDGERSFLGRMCLFLLLGETESLILLDEPEVHFNDYWKRHIVSLLDDVIRQKNRKQLPDQLTTSHILLATHSSIALTDVHRDDILVLEREGLQTDSIRIPRIKTFGADPSELMVHVFGAPFATGEYSVTRVTQWLKDARNKKDEQESKKYLKQKLEEVAPGYWAYRIRREMMGLRKQ